MAENTGLRITANFGQVIGVLQRGATPAQVNAALYQAMTKSVINVHGRAQQKLSGEVLNVDEGFLRGQLQWQVSPDGRLGVVGSNLEYAAIQEFGGRTGPHMIEVHDFDSALPISVVASSVRTRGAAGTIFRAVVHHPGATVPARPYLRPALQEAREDIKGYLIESLRGLLAGDK